MKLLRLIKMCLNETSSRVWEGKHLPDKFPLRNGLKKGVALSPFLLNFALGYAIRIVQVNQDGLKLMLNPLTSTIVASPSNARNANVCFRTTFVWQHWHPSLSIWLHNVLTLNQSWKQSCVIFVCKHLATKETLISHECISVISLKNVLCSLLCLAFSKWTRMFWQ